MRILIDGQTFSTPEATRGIGVASRRLIEHLITTEIANDWFLTVRRQSDAKCFHPRVRARLKTLSMPEAIGQPGGTWQTDIYSAAVSAAVAQQAIDLFWTPNPLMHNTVLPTGLNDVSVLATIYDLIPWVMKREYYDQWDKAHQQEYRRRLDTLPGWADRLAFISHSARDDYVAYAPQVADKSSVVHLAVDHARFSPRVVPAGRDSEKYVLMVGGFDPRKNMEAALEAFAQLVRQPPYAERPLKFYVVCSCTDASRAEYERLAERHGVADRLVLTGYVPDEDLVGLYRKASAFFFPSKYEGFGLPVLEAMACGVPVVTTGGSSLPEVAGETAFYCSADDPADMARALAEALGTSGEDVKRRTEEITRARRFTWPTAAADYARLLVDLQFPKSVRVAASRPRIAYASPWPPQRTGIADYSRELVSQLKDRVDTTLFLPDAESATDCHGLPVEPLSGLPAAIQDYDVAVYHIGNNANFHREIYETAWHHPGIVMLHDYNIHPFLKDAFRDTPEEQLFFDSLQQSHGLAPEQYHLAEENLFEYPMCKALVQRSRATIVHSRWVRQQLADIDNVYVIPHPGLTTTVEATDAQIESFRLRYHVEEKEFIVSCLGFVNPLKRIGSALEAIRQVIDRGYSVRFVIGGAETDPALGIGEKIKTLGLEKHVVMTGFLDEIDLDALIQASDVVLNLRCPSMGESSGSLIRALGRGKACLVSNFRQFTELPDDVCWKADVTGDEVPQLVAFITHLLRNPDVRGQLGRNAAAFIQNHASIRDTALRHAEIIAAVCADGLSGRGKTGVADPAQRPDRRQQAA